MEVYLQQLCYLILLFFIFSVFGWCMEVVLKYIQYHRFINRGFLVGPYCPIYGSGIVFVTLLVEFFSGVETSVGTTFVISFVGCGILEYAVSYYMEKRFHARWWDYSTKPMNLHGRVWIGNLILFGIGGTVVIELINPVMFSLFDKIPTTVLYVLSIAIVFVMTGDYVTSHFIMKFVKTSVETSEADNTESISREIKLLLKDKSVLYRRIADAYPEVVYHTDRIKAKMQEVRAELEHINYNIELIKLDPSEVRDEIINIQEQLIVLLQQSPEKKQEIEALTIQLENKKKLLEERKNLYRINNKRQEIQE